MKLKYLFVLLILINHTIGFAQFSKFQCLESNSSTEGNSIATDQVGNFYITGGYSGQIDCDPGNGAYLLSTQGYFDVLVCKYKSTGELVWAKTFGEENDERGYGITVDKLGNVYTLGYFQGTIDFDPGAGVFTMTSVGTSDLFITKLDNDGNFIWAKQITGISNQPVSNGCGINRGLPLAIDSLNNLIITGNFYGTSDFDPSSNVTALTAKGYMDGYVLKLDPDGNLVWVKQFGGPGYNSMVDVSYAVVDKSNNVYIMGKFYETIDFDPSNNDYVMTAVPYSTSSGEGFLTKLDVSGNFVWAKQLGGVGNGLALDPSRENVYLSGIFSNTIDANPDAGTLTMTAKSVDVFTTKLSTDGTHIWSNQFKGTITTGSYAFDITVDDSYVYVFGSADGTVDFDPGVGVANNAGDFYVTLNLDGSYNSFNTAKWTFVKSVSHPSGNHYATGFNDCLFISGDFIADPDVSTGLIANYTFNNNFDDATANQYNPIDSGAVLSQDRNNLSNSACYFDGNSKMKIGIDFHQSSGLTIAAWINSSSSNNSLYYFLTGDFGGFFVMPGQVGCAINTPGTNSVYASLTSDQWVHFAATYNGKNIIAYLNGVPVDTTYWPWESGSPSYGKDSISFAEFNDNYWKGKMDEVRIYNRVLKAADIQAVYQLNSTTTGIAPVAFYSDLISMYPVPVQSELVFTAEGNGEAEVSIFDSQGRIVKKEVSELPQGSIEMNNLPKGIYLIQISANGKFYRNKIVKD